MKQAGTFRSPFVRSPRACSRFLRAARALVFAAVLTVQAHAQWNESVLYSFQGGNSDGAVPVGGIVFDKAGNIYGATQGGGANTCSPMAACGTVYQLIPPINNGGKWTEKVLYVFRGKAANDGDFPGGGLAIDSIGNLYGTAYYGGTGDCVLLGIKGGCGVVFKLSPPEQAGGTWREAILYSFKGGSDGYVPFGDLTFDADGNLYGVTLYGGGRGGRLCDSFYTGCGTVFKLSPPTQKGGGWKEEVLYRFAAGTDGYNPNGGLIIDHRNHVYGTTESGGNQQCNYGTNGLGCGTLFELIPPSKMCGTWTEQILHRFTGKDDGANPAVGVTTFGGHIYGSTGGGGPFKRGLLFEMTQTKEGWDENVLYDFNGGNDGQGPGSPLRFDTDGSLYGTAIGGADFSGVVFQLSPRLNDQPLSATSAASWAFDLLYTFKGVPDAHYPGDSLILVDQNQLYGTAGGGMYDDGAVFEVWP
ncbi:MAG TPA: choice-of-anchor tandem repeat GloVer-containing protein [Terriglobales bacterium]